MFLTRDRVRELDRRAIRDYGVPGLVLMENAGRGAAELLVSLGIHGPVLIGCGKGNNGGDGLVIARHLQLRQIHVKVLLFAEPGDLSPAAAANWRIVQQSGLAAEVWPAPEEARLRNELARCDWFVDALLGTGLEGPARPPFDRVIAAVNASRARVFAVDIPSGLDADTGQPHGAAIRAHYTATFVAPKLGYAHPAATPWLGKVHVIDIGAPAKLVAEFGS